MLVCVLAIRFAHETAGAARTRSSLRPLFEGRACALYLLGADEFAKPRAQCAARMRRCVVIYEILRGAGLESAIAAQ